MVAMRTIQIDEEVWAELQRRAVALIDDENTVLRRVFVLDAAEASPLYNPAQSEMDERISKLMALVRYRISQAEAQRTKTNLRHCKFLCKRGTIAAFLLDQPRSQRLRLETSKKMAERVRLPKPDSSKERGWFYADTSYYYVAEDGDDESYRRLADILVDLWEA